MKSVGVRIAFWYALASLITLSCFFRVGRYLVEQHMIHSLDLGINAEFEQVKRRLGNDAATLGPAQIYGALMTNASVRYSIEIHQPDGTLLYRSRDLNNRTIPTTPMPGHMVSIALNRLFKFLKIGSPQSANESVRTYNAVVGDLGEMRIGEYLLDDRIVRIAVSKDQVRTLVVAFQDVFYGMVALMVIASSVIGFFLSYILLRPLRQIQATAAHISSANLSERIPVSSVEDEISNLARLLNQMFDRLESSFNQVRRFTAEASHELKTPLSLMRLQTEKLLMEGKLTAVQEESLHVVIEEITRLNQIIEELLFLSRAEADAITLSRKVQDPRHYMESFIPDARVLADSRGITLEDSHEGSGWVEFDPRWLRQVLFNLLTNALNYTPAGRQIDIESRLTPDSWQVAIEDDGPGVPEEMRERIFERFVRLAHATQHDKGSGLGLAICRSIIALHQGHIWAESPHRGKGLRVVFELPLSPAPTAAKPDSG